MAQIIETARGSLISRLNAQPLAFGELFIHTADDIDLVEYKGGTGLEIKDLTTDSRIKKVFKGDLFAGNNSSTEVFALGSGSSLKWGGVVSGPWNIVKDTAVLSPNFIYMYQGTSITVDVPLSTIKGNNPIDAIKDNEDPRAKKKTIIIGKYVADSSSEYYDKINPGDLVFYSPVKDHVVVIHLSHSSDALVKLNVEKLISDSIRNQFEQITPGDETSNNLNKATLKTFLDGPARFYQQLTDKNGWEPLAYSYKEEETELGNKKIIVEDAWIGGVDGDKNPILGIHDGDGWIHYMPWIDGRQEIILHFPNNNEGELIEPAVTIHEGDLVLSIPTPNGKVRHEVISLYGQLLKLNNPDSINIKRADDYADEIYREHDLNLIENAKVIKSFIEDLYTTKVDIDPVTKKIISSQLPDYILGALKYQGIVTENDVIENDTDAEKLLNFLIDKTTGASTDIENSADADGNKDEYKSDTAIKVGSYWIYQGTERFVIDGYDHIFNLIDITSNKELPPSIDLGDSKDSSDSSDLSNQADSTGDSTEKADSGDSNDPNKITGDDWDGLNFIHALNPGDWIVWNGKKFDIIDNSSTFLGLLLHGIKCAGLVEFTEFSRKNKFTDFDNHDLAPKSTEIQVVAKSENKIEFSSNNSVLFKDEFGKSALVDEKHLPVITNNGWAINSRFEFVDGTAWGEATNSGKQIGLQIATTYGDKKSTQFIIRDLYKDYTELESTKLSRTWDELELVEGFIREKLEDDSFVHYYGKFEGFNFGDITFIKGTNESDYYSFQIESEDNVKLQLPLHSGTLATEQYVDAGFVVTKKLIEDAVAILQYESTSGNVDWLQTIVEYEIGGEKAKKVFDSKVLQEYVKDKYLFLDLFFDAPEKAGDKTTGRYSQLKVLKQIKDNYDHSGANFGTGEGNDNFGGFDYEIGNKIFNPSTLPNGTDGKTVENVLPNHSGILLNSQSVIDGGYWA